MRAVKAAKRWFVVFYRDFIIAIFFFFYENNRFTSLRFMGCKIDSIDSNFYGFDNSEKVRNHFNVLPESPDGIKIEINILPFFYKKNIKN